MSKSVTTFNYDVKERLSRKGLTGLLRLLSGFRLRYTLAMAALALGMFAKTSTYLLLRYFVDTVLPAEGRTYQLALIAAAFVGLAGVQGFLTFTSGRLTAQTAEGIIQRLRNFLFGHIQGLSFTYHDNAKTGELIQRATSDVEALRRFYSEQAVASGRILLLFSVNLIAIINLNWKLALASIAALPVLIMVSLFFFKKIARVYEAFQEQEAKLTATLQESLTGIRVVKAFARQQFEREKFNNDNQEKFLRGKHLISMHAFFWPATDVLCTLQLLVCYTVGALMVMNGSLTLGAFLAFAGMIIWIIFPLRNLGRVIVQISQARVSYNRIAEIIAQDPEALFHGAGLASEVSRGRFVFKEVGFNYGDAEVLTDISFSCEPGEVVALLGPTGSGKTSLVNLLPRFYEYTAGSITLDGTELRTLNKEFLRRHIAIVEQEPFLFSVSIGENIAYGMGRDVTQKEIESAAKVAAIHATICEFPEAYETIVGEKGVTLSGGQKQRVAIARALMKDPQVLILDDSTSSVDTETEQSIWQALEQLMQSRTTFIIAHRIQSLMKADLILVLDEGRIIQRGTHRQLVEEQGVYRRIYELQSRIETELQEELAHV